MLKHSFIKSDHWKPMAESVLPPEERVYTAERGAKVSTLLFDTLNMMLGRDGAAPVEVCVENDGVTLLYIIPLEVPGRKTDSLQGDSPSPKYPLVPPDSLRSLEDVKDQLRRGDLRLAFFAVLLPRTPRVKRIVDRKGRFFLRKEPDPHYWDIIEDAVLIRRTFLAPVLKTVFFERSLSKVQQDILTNFLKNRGELPQPREGTRSTEL